MISYGKALGSKLPSSSSAWNGSHPDRCAILLSPAPVDGYPPVQHQAQLLAQHGFDVELITVPRLSGTREVSFSYPGVTPRVLPFRKGRGLQTAVRLTEFIATLTCLRARVDRAHLIEIAYDPLAMIISDFAPARPYRRVAHFHESLDAFEKTWTHKRLRYAISSYQTVVVADHARARHLAQQLELPELPHVVQNYPMRLELQPPPDEITKNDGFEVIYMGSIGRDQKLHILIDALCHCPEHVYVTILGNHELPAAKQLIEKASELGLSERVRFPGWLDYAKVSQRLAKARLAFSFYDPEQINTRQSVGASNKRYEYMRAGLPQIGDMNPGVPDLIEGNTIGRCVTSFCPQELAALICSYVEAPTRCSAEGQRAWELHRKNFNYQTAFRPVLSEFSSVAGSLAACP